MLIGNQNNGIEIYFGKVKILEHEFDRKEIEVFVKGQSYGVSFLDWGISLNIRSHSFIFTTKFWGYEGDEKMIGIHFFPFAIINQ